ncbi:MrcB family domain-containing protein [Streptomyces sp. NPDC056600]|uniref:MrcB family domain-containing protein n=1 Tax=Streptomyces sp. NPDC056600 TaxID=3345874 RepID=UPI003696FB14
MNGFLAQVMDLQRAYTWRVTPEMERRGRIVKREVPGALEAHRAAMAGALDIPVERVLIEGADGVGRKSVVPWVRVSDVTRSPSAMDGWYVVLLFAAGGERAYLTLMQGTTYWTGTELRSRGAEALAARVDWAYPHVAEAAEGRGGLLRRIALPGGKKLGRAYELGTVVALEYRRDALPDTTGFVDDLLFMAGLLRRVYAAETTATYIPGDPIPEVLDAEVSAERAAGRSISEPRPRPAAATRSGQGFLLSAVERRLIERHSVRMATEHFEAQGWKVADVGANQPYDLHLTRDDATRGDATGGDVTSRRPAPVEELHVEVKGTTSLGQAVVLTRAEVEAQREFAPRNALVIVHSIRLDRSGAEVTAEGGVLHCTSPWRIDQPDLTPISYRYRTDLA